MGVAQKPRRLVEHCETVDRLVSVMRSSNKYSHLLAVPHSGSKNDRAMRRSLESWWGHVMQVDQRNRICPERGRKSLCTGNTP